jgi:hypothetical protein
MTAAELRHGQEKLFRQLYAPEAFAARLLGNLGRFHDVKYRPEPIALDKLATFFRLVGHYWRRGKLGRRFFWGILGKTLCHSPRSLRQVIMMLGMFKHFCEVHGQTSPWDPWAAHLEAPVPTGSGADLPVESLCVVHAGLVAPQPQSLAKG